MIFHLSPRVLVDDHGRMALSRVLLLGNRRRDVLDHASVDDVEGPAAVAFVSQVLASEVHTPSVPAHDYLP